ncbi:hypothetical protein [Streptomyces sp. NPDC088360]
MEHADLADEAFAPYVAQRWRHNLNEALVPAEWIDDADDPAAQDE